MGAIGRGDAFILQIADQANSVVFSNDSFQEFHGEYTWLFDDAEVTVVSGTRPEPTQAVAERYGVPAAVDISLLSRSYGLFADHAVTIGERSVHVIPQQVNGSVNLR